MLPSGPSRLIGAPDTGGEELRGVKRSRKCRHDLLKICADLGTPARLLGPHEGPGASTGLMLPKLT